MYMQKYSCVKRIKSRKRIQLDLAVSLVERDQLSETFDPDKEKICWPLLNI